RYPTGATCYLSQIHHATPQTCRRLIRYLEDERNQSESSARLILGSEFTYEELYEGGILESDFLDLAAQVRVRIPALRERVEDIPILCHYQLWLHCDPAELEERWSEFRTEVLPGLLDYPWPGNVDELNALICEFCGDGYEEEESGDEAWAATPVTVVDPVAFLAEEFTRYHAELVELIRLEQTFGRNDLVLLPETDRGIDDDDN
ncbi:MAG: hypothetical protein KDC38_17740, partial [Planctomycetes bacterium]|nr:hypothetical protein [Planctomycetota bacterium]